MKTIEVEIAVMKHCNIRQNIVVPNVSFGMVRYFIGGCDELHECDILNVTKSGYATEYEIKVSKSDLLAEKKKKHSHDSNFIKQLFYVVPEKMKQFALDNIKEEAGLYVVKDNGKMQCIKNAEINKDCFKWTNAEMFKLAKLGTMRILGLKQKLIK